SRSTPTRTGLRLRTDLFSHTGKGFWGNSETFFCDTPRQRVVEPDERAAPAYGQRVQDADLAQRAAVGAGPSEETRRAPGLLRAALDALDEGFAQRRAGHEFPVLL